MYQILQQSLRNRESVILGDFNLPHIDWQTLTAVEAESHRMLEFIHDNFLSYLLAEPTRENNILDFVITSQEHLINSITVGEYLGSCDHRVVRAEINTTTNIVENTTLNVSEAHYRTCHRQPQQRNFIPNCVARSSNNKNHPWFSSKVKRALKPRNNLHKRVKSLRSTENIRFYNEARDESKC